MTDLTKKQKISENHLWTEEFMNYWYIEIKIKVIKTFFKKILLFQNVW